MQVYCRTMVYASARACAAVVAVLPPACRAAATAVATELTCPIVGVSTTTCAAPVTSPCRGERQIRDTSVGLANSACLTEKCVGNCCTCIMHAHSSGGAARCILMPLKGAYCACFPGGRKLGHRSARPFVLTYLRDGSNEGQCGDGVELAVDGWIACIHEPWPVNIHTTVAGACA